MNTNPNKRAAVYAVSVLPLIDANINNTPGFSSIRVQGEWQRLAASKIDFAEKEVNDGFDVNLKIRITTTSAEMQSYLLQLCGQEIVCRLHSTDCVDRVLGTGDCPVTFRLSKKDMTQYFELEYKGVQPEMAKILQSF